MQDCINSQELETNGRAHSFGINSGIEVVGSTMAPRSAAAASRSKTLPSSRLR